MGVGSVVVGFGIFGGAPIFSPEVPKIPDILKEYRGAHVP